MDDCSNDNSYNICKEFEDNERVKVFKNKSNIGLTKSLNILAEQSNATYLARQDADDLSDLQRIEIQKRYLKKIIMTS
jgi:glycosyltransferase involved in cell wall biosynthesis